jgi:hypothetical protein
MPEFLFGLLLGLILGCLLNSKNNVQQQPQKKDPADWWKEPKEE